MNLQTLPGLFISHGSPMLALDPEQVGPALHRLSHNLPKPEAIVVMSAHWESQALEVSTSTRPQTWHDFRGFPPPYIKFVTLPLVHLKWLKNTGIICRSWHIGTCKQYTSPRSWCLDAFITYVSRRRYSRD